MKDSGRENLFPEEIMSSLLMRKPAYRPERENTTH